MLLTLGCTCAQGSGILVRLGVHSLSSQAESLFTRFEHATYEA